MNIFWVIIEVNFKKPMHSEGAETPKIIGFFQTFGCTESTEGAMKKEINSCLIESEWFEVHGAEVEYDISVIDRKDVESEILLDEEINDFLQSSPYNKGIWYKSGKAFFHGNAKSSEM